MASLKVNKHMRFGFFLYKSNFGFVLRVLCAVCSFFYGEAQSQDQARNLHIVTNENVVPSGLETQDHWLIDLYERGFVDIAAIFVKPLFQWRHEAFQSLKTPEIKCALCKEGAFQEKRKKSALVYSLTLEDISWSDGHKLDPLDFVLSFEVISALRKKSPEAFLSFAPLESVEAVGKGGLELRFNVRTDGYFLANFFPLPHRTEGAIWRNCEGDISCYLKNANYSYQRARAVAPSLNKWVLTFQRGVARFYRSDKVSAEFFTQPNGSFLSVDFLSEADLQKAPSTSRDLYLWSGASFSKDNAWLQKIAGLSPSSASASSSKSGFFAALPSDTMSFLGWNLRNTRWQSSQTRRSFLFKNDAVAEAFYESALWKDLNARLQRSTVFFHRWFTAVAQRTVHSRGTDQGHLHNGFDIQFPSEDSTRLKLFQFLKKVGPPFDFAKADSVSSSRFFNHTLTKTGFRDLVLFHAHSSRVHLGGVPFSLLHSSRTFQFSNDRSARGNLSSWHNGETDRLVLRSTYDPEAHEQLLSILLQEVPYLPVLPHFDLLFAPNLSLEEIKKDFLLGEIVNALQ